MWYNIHDDEKSLIKMVIKIHGLVYKNYIAFVLICIIYLKQKLKKH